MGSVRFATGEEPETLDARIRWENGIDVFADVSAQFQSFGYHGYTSIRMHPWQHVVFHGERGLMRLTAPFNPLVFGEARIEIHKQNQEINVERFPSARQYELQVEAFCRSVREGVEYPVPLEFSRGTQAMIDRAFESAGPPKD
jgi:predicted dehydrogenase